MALARYGIVAVTRPNVIWGRNLRRGLGTGMGKYHRLRVQYGSEMIDSHISKGAADKQLAPPQREARAASAVMTFRCGPHPRRPRPGLRPLRIQLHGRLMRRRYIGYVLCITAIQLVTMSQHRA